MPDDKSPDNGRLIKKFYRFFWDDVKQLSFSLFKAYEKGESSPSQRQTVIRRTEKKDTEQEQGAFLTPLLGPADA